MIRRTDPKKRWRTFCKKSWRKWIRRAIRGTAWLAAGLGTAALCVGTVVGCVAAGVVLGVTAGSVDYQARFLSRRSADPKLVITGEHSTRFIHDGHG